MGGGEAQAHITKEKLIWWKGPHGFIQIPWNFGSGEGVSPIEPWLLERLPTTSSNKVLTSDNKQI